MAEVEKRCIGCGSTRLVPNARLIDRSGLDKKSDLTLEIYGKPDALIFKNTKKCVLNAVVCGECGHVALYVDDPEDLWRIHSRRQDA